MTGPAGPADGTAWRSIGRLGLLVLGLLAGGLAVRTFAGGLDAALLDRLVVGQGMRGRLIFVLLAASACATGVPRQATGFAAGYAFAAESDLVQALVLAMAAQMLGCMLDFYWARAIGRQWARARVRGRLARLEAVLVGHPFVSTLIMRLLPVSNNLAFNLLGGASAVRTLPFMAASALGYLPQTLVFLLLGSGTRVSGWQQIALAGALFVGSVGLSVWLLRRHRMEAAALSEGS